MPDSMYDKEWADQSRSRRVMNECEWINTRGRCWSFGGVNFPTARNYVILRKGRSIQLITNKVKELRRNPHWQEALTKESRSTRGVAWSNVRVLAVPPAASDHHLLWVLVTWAPCVALYGYRRRYFKRWQSAFKVHHSVLAYIIRTVL